MNSEETILSARNLTVGYGSKQVLKDLNLTLNSGKLTCLLGPNGSGKSTLIRTLSKIQKPLLGSIELEQRPIDQFDNKILSTKLSMVLTDKTSPGNLTAYALVSLGRFPYTSWIGTLSKADKQKIHWAMEATDCIQFSDIHIGELSDGERQKVMIARALTQDTPMIFLDEPTAHLDLPNRIEIFHLLKKLAKEEEKAILISTHEMNMAIANADLLWLINDKTISKGAPEDLVLNGTLEKAFKSGDLNFNYESGEFQKPLVQHEQSVYVEGPELIKIWTKRAFERNGFSVVGALSANIVVHASGDLGEPNWRVIGQNTTYSSIHDLLNAVQ